MNRAADRVLEGSNRVLLARLAVIVVVMFGFGYAMIPFYDQICRATGLRNIAAADAVTNTQVDAGRTVRIELDANVNKLPWDVATITLSYTFFEVEGNKS